MDANECNKVAECVKLQKPQAYSHADSTLISVHQVCAKSIVQP